MRKFIASLYFLSFIFPIEYPQFIFEDILDFDQSVGKKVSYKIYKIKSDGSRGNLIVDSQKLNGKLFSSKYKLHFDFSKGDYRIEFNLKDNQKKYHASLDIKRSWFNSPYTAGKRRLKAKNKFPPNVKLVESTYPYTFRVQLKKTNPVLRGYVYTRDENNYIQAVEGAEIRLHGNTKNYRNLKIGSKFSKTSDEGTFEWEVGFNDTLSFTPSIIITKEGFHLERTYYTKEEINDALKTDKREIFLHKRLSPRNDPHRWKDCQSISEYLTYNPQCDECVCQDPDEKFYHKMGICDRRTCGGDSTLVFRNNFGKGTDQIVYGEMKGVCELSEQINITNSTTSGTIIKNVLGSLNIYLNDKPIADAIIKYSSHKNKNGEVQALGKTDKNGRLVVNKNYQFFDNTEKINVSDRLGNLNLDFNPENYFFLRKKEFKKKRPHRFSIEYNNKIYPFKIKNVINSNNISEMNCVDISVSLFDNSEEVVFVVSENKKQNYEKLDIKHTKVKKLKGQEFYDQCSRNYSAIDSLVEACEWDLLPNYIDDVIEICNIDKNTGVLLNIIRSLFNRVLEYDDALFVEELFYRTSYLNAPIFSIIDALYERYDQVKGAVESELSNYEIAHHYYRKFHFYFLYAEYLTINQSIITSDDGRDPTIWIYDFGYEDEVKNFRELLDVEVYKHIRQRSKEALDQFQLVKNKSKGEKLGDFHELELMKNNLEVIIDEWRLIK